MGVSDDAWIVQLSADECVVSCPVIASELRDVASHKLICLTRLLDSICTSTMRCG
jgi:hypothetical protein